MFYSVIGSSCCIAPCLQFSDVQYMLKENGPQLLMLKRNYNSFYGVWYRIPTDFNIKVWFTLNGNLKERLFTDTL